MNNTIRLHRAQLSSVRRQRRRHNGRRILFTAPSPPAFLSTGFRGFRVKEELLDNNDDICGFFCHTTHPYLATPQIVRLARVGRCRIRGGRPCSVIRRTRALTRTQRVNIYIIQ